MDISTVIHFLNWLLMIAIPVGLAIFLIEKFHTGWKIWLIGASIFIISQIFHIPFNQFLLNPLLVKMQSSAHGLPGQLIVALLLGLSAGVFEETARYGMYRWWLKVARTWRNSVLAGAGHGGIEAIILGILVMVGFIQLVAYRNVDLSAFNLTYEQLSIAQQQIQSYWNLPWYYALMGALERAFTIPFHIAASVLVLQVFTRQPGRQRLGWLGLAIIYHTMMDALAVFVGNQWGVYAAEAVIGGSVLIDLIIIFALRQPEPKPEIPANVPPLAVPRFIPQTPVEETSENLDKTRYQ